MGMLLSTPLSLLRQEVCQGTIITTKNKVITSKQLVNLMIAFRVKNSAK